MSELFVVIGVSVMTVLSGLIGGYVGIKYALNKAKTELPNMVLDLLDELVPELPKLLAKDETRQFIYSVGVLIGNGAKAGVGLSGGKGKFKFEDLLGGIAQELLPKVLGNITGGQQQQPSGQPQQGW